MTMEDDGNADDDGKMDMGYGLALTFSFFVSYLFSMWKGSL